MRRNPRYDQSVPVHFQVEMLLRRRCGEEWAPGTRVPSESALCGEYHVARSTLRRALRMLESDKVIRREKGRGTFVSSEPLAVQVKKLTGSIQDFITHGIDTHANVYIAKAVLANQRVARVLGIRESDVVAQVARVRYVGGRPLADVNGYLPWDVGTHVLKDDLKHLSILHLLTRKYRMPVSEAEQTVEAVLADPYVAKKLEIPAGSPVLKIERVFFTRKRRAVYYTDTHYRADRYKFSVLLNHREASHQYESTLMYSPRAAKSAGALGQTRRGA
ncbi:MAG: GntR family transcriptional regulator [bacterium]